MAAPIINAKPWKGQSNPTKILVMRFQAMGDMVITLPYLQDLKDQLPDTEIHFLTRKEVSDIPEKLEMFSRVIVIRGGRNKILQLLLSLRWIPFLWWQRYDVILDLQNHRLSRIIRKLLIVKYWSEFDRNSPVSAGERTQVAINSSAVAIVKIANSIKFQWQPVEEKMKSNGWQQGKPFIILNPAGGFESRNWPIEYYSDFAKRWLKKDPGMQFMVIGLPSLFKKITLLKNKLGNSLIDLTGVTTPSEAYQIVRRAKLVLSEDSGLMHMAWTQRIPTVAIFGSTPSVWSTPLGDWSYCFNSSDLPCGNCFLEKCKFNDNHCLTRWTGETVFEKSVELTPAPLFSFKERGQG
jgi:heptosyltransferase-2